LYKHSCYYRSFLIGKWKSFCPLCKDINTSKNINRTSSGTTMWTSQINAHTLKRRTSNNWLQSSTTWQLTTMIATTLRTTSTKHNCVFSPTRPERTSLDLVTGLSNAQMATTNTTTRQFNDVLTDPARCQ